MAIYLINYILIVLYSFFIKDKKKYILLASFQLFLIMALRDVTIGADMGVYMPGYDYIGSMSFLEMFSRLSFVQQAELIYPYAFEIGYVFLNWIIYNMGFDFHGFLVIISAFMIGSFGYFVYRYSKIPYLSFALYMGFTFYTYNFDILRQSLAVHLLLWAVPLIEKKKPFRVLLLLLVAFTLHRTSIIFAPLYIMINFVYDRRMIILTFVSEIAIIAAFPLLIDKIIVPFMIALKRDYAAVGELSYNNQIVLMNLILLAVFIFVDLKKCDARIDRIILWGYAISLFVETIGLYNDYLARIIEYYFIFVTLLIPRAIEQYENEKLKRIGQVFLVIFLGLFYAYTLKSSYIVPYKLYMF